MRSSWDAHRLSLWSSTHVIIMDAQAAPRFLWSVDQMLRASWCEPMLVTEAMEVSRLGLSQQDGCGLWREAPLNRRTNCRPSHRRFSQIQIVGTVLTVSWQVLCLDTHSQMAYTCKFTQGDRSPVSSRRHISLSESCASRGGTRFNGSIYRRILISLTLFITKCNYHFQRNKWSPKPSLLPSNARCDNNILRMDRPCRQIELFGANSKRKDFANTEQQTDSGMLRNYSIRQWAYYRKKLHCNCWPIIGHRLPERYVFDDTLHCIDKRVRWD